MLRAVRLGLLVVVVVASATAPIAGDHRVPADAPRSAPVTGVGQADLDADALRLEVTLRGEDPARLSVEYRFQLDGDDGNRTEAFESLREDVESNPDPYKERFRSLLEPTVRRAENATDREMELRNVTVSAGHRFAGNIGYVAYTVEWTNFAVEHDGRLRAGAALSGLYLDERTKLLVAWSDTYRLTDVSPEPAETRDRAVVWEGPLEFASSEPRVSLLPAGAARSLVDRLPGGPATVVGLSILAAFGGLALIVRRRRNGHATTVPSDPELMSNEERVIHALEEHGGRLRQQELAESLEWTDPKTSRVVNRLREDEAVDVFRLGRENVVSLPDYDDQS